MKKKNIKKIISLTINEINSRRNSEILEPVREHVDWNDYNTEVSEKFKKMFINLLNYRENLRLEINQEVISISVEDLTNIRGKSKLSHLNSEENHLRLEVTKEGFQINRGYNRRSHFRDENMYNELLPISKECQLKFNSDMFNNVWSEIMKDSGIVRDHNLDELFNG